MIQRQQLVLAIADILQPQLFNDYCPNGLQVEGKDSIKKIVSGVTASVALFEAAIKAKADAILVHHGLFWKGDSAVITGMKRHRIRMLLEHNINLLAYHLPLDCHLELGNNKQIAILLELQQIKTITLENTPNLLWLGEFAKPMTPLGIAQLLTQRLQRTPEVIVPTHFRPIHRIALCTGGAQKYITQAAEHHADAYLSGEISEATYHSARELEIVYFAAGHHATERYGVQALANFLADKFKLEHEYIEIENPV